MKICLYAFFPRFKLAMDVPAFSFYGICCQFLNSYDSISFQIFSYWATHAFPSETLNEIV